MSAGVVYFMQIFEALDFIKQYNTNCMLKSLMCYGVSSSFNYYGLNSTEFNDIVYYNNVSIR